jgi:hypothetical protein
MRKCLELWAAALALTSLLACAGQATAAQAAPLVGKRAIVLSNASGEKHTIGHVNFTDAGNGKSSFKIVMADNMEEYFLAMRPFLCLTGPVQRLCWFPVHNEEALVADDDLLPLEYALMFMRTKAKDLHVNPFNGMYYKLRRDGTRLVGELHEVDMAPFIAPDMLPVEERKRPLKPADFNDADPGSNWLPRMSIE